MKETRCFLQNITASRIVKSEPYCDENVVVILTWNKPFRLPGYLGLLLISL